MAAKRATVEDVAHTLRTALEDTIGDGTGEIAVTEAGTRLATADTIVDVTPDVDALGGLVDFQIQLEDGRWFRVRVSEQMR